MPAPVAKSCRAGESGTIPSVHCVFVYIMSTWSNGFANWHSGSPCRVCVPFSADHWNISDPEKMATLHKPGKPSSRKNVIAQLMKDNAARVARLQIARPRGKSIREMRNYTWSLVLKENKQIAYFLYQKCTVFEATSDHWLRQGPPALGEKAQEEQSAFWY